jgi:hypothetical protein
VDKNTPVPMEEYCCKTSAPKEQGDLCWPVELEMGSWVRSTRMQSYRTNGSYRSELRIPGNLESQPGATMYLTNMPVAAGAKGVKATYHSHTADAARRDDCNMVRLKVPGLALARSTGAPVFRFERSSPEWTINWGPNEGFASRYVADFKSLFDQLRVVIGELIWSG